MNASIEKVCIDAEQGQQHNNNVNNQSNKILE